MEGRCAAIAAASSRSEELRERVRWRRPSMKLRCASLWAGLAGALKLRVTGGEVSASMIRRSETWARAVSPIAGQDRPAAISRQARRPVILFERHVIAVLPAG